MPDDASPIEINVYVHLAYGFGLASWRERFLSGRLIGINEDNAYGYLHATEMSCRVVISYDTPETRMQRLLRFGARILLGFDFVHAWKNRQRLFAADVVWTHTESQSLAILAVLWLSARKIRPRTIMQTIWMMDGWDRLSRPRKKLYKQLLSGADILTFHSPLAVKKARRVFAGKRIELVRFGIKARSDWTRTPSGFHEPVHILSLGNDRHRDWPTLVSALSNNPIYQVRIATGQNLSKLIHGSSNITVEPLFDNEDLKKLFQWADLVVICLTENLHASGITVIEEAVVQAIPVICTDAGGLTSYFAADEVCYVTAGDPSAVRLAVAELVANNALRRAKVARALIRMQNGEINSRSFVARHVALSRELLARRL